MAAALADLIPRYVEAMRVRNFAASTIETQAMLTRWFVAWCAERELHTVDAITRDIVERYQRHLFTLRVRVGAPRRAAADQPEAAALRPLSVRGQHARLWAVVRFFRWAVRTGLIEHSPASMIEMPRLPRPLPKPALSVVEVERIVAVPDLTTPNGLRDRAMLEVFYACGIRRGELVALTIDDVDRERGVVRVREGKGRKGRVVPISKRALAWLDRYIAEVWSQYPRALEHRRLFLSVADARRRHQGQPLRSATVSHLMGLYVFRSGVEKTGACHVFRHTAATLMMENGADIRAIQDFLGHAEIKTTGIYTNVSLKFLKEQHAKTHPSAFAAAAAEAKPTPM